MQLHGLPNDILPNIDPITIIIVIPFMDRFIYPFIRSRLRFALSPITRITWGFVVAALAMAYAAVLQHQIYVSSPCYRTPLNCSTSSMDTHTYYSSDIHVAWQAPAYILIAVSEILASITGLELAYAKAPENMKSFIMSLFLLTSAGGSALGIFIAPSAKDPHMAWLYTGLACAAAGAGGIFYWIFKDMAHKASRLDKSVEDDVPLQFIA